MADPNTHRRGRDLGGPVAGVRYLTAAKFGSEIGVSPRTVMTMAQTNQIDYCHLGRWRILIPETELERPEFAERRARARVPAAAA